MRRLQCPRSVAVENSTCVSRHKSSCAMLNIFLKASKRTHCGFSSGSAKDIAEGRCDEADHCFSIVFDDRSLGMCRRLFRIVCVAACLIRSYFRSFTFTPLARGAIADSAPSKRGTISLSLFAPLPISRAVRPCQNGAKRCSLAHGRTQAQRRAEKARRARSALMKPRKSQGEIRGAVTGKTGRLKTRAKTRTT